MGTEIPPTLDDEVLDPDIARLRRAVHQIDEWTAKRDQAARDLRARGFTLRAIAEAAGMTHTGVRKLLARDGEDTSAET